jgi:hypothetical protein
MNEKNLPAITVTTSLPAPQANAWLAMAAKKNTLEEVLKRNELAAQQLLLNIEDKDLAEALKKYRATHGIMVETRKEFTSMIDKGIIQKLMEYEKRVDPNNNQTFKDAAKKELNYREEQQKQLEKERGLQQEAANFDTHFRNEFISISVKYRGDLKYIIHQTYTDCLSAKTPANNIGSAIKIASEAMREVKASKPNAFTRNYLSSESAQEIYAKIPKINFSSILNEMLEELKNKFELYANDLASQPEKIVEQENNSFNAEVVQDISDMRSEQAANALMANATAYVEAPEGFKGITELSRIVILDESPEWVLKILTAFLANFQKCFSTLQVKKYSQLKVQQMAIALDAAGVKVEGVQYETIKK